MGRNKLNKMNQMTMPSSIKTERFKFPFWSYYTEVNIKKKMQYH